MSINTLGNKSAILVTRVQCHHSLELLGLHGLLHHRATCAAVRPVRVTMNWSMKPLVRCDMHYTQSRKLMKAN
jgi:hypothetical protein